jgi:hypothetical protein
MRGIGINLAWSQHQIDVPAEDTGAQIHYSIGMGEMLVTFTLLSDQLL